MSNLEKIKEVCSNLGIEEVEVRTVKDPDVNPYVQKVDYQWVKVKLPEEFLKIKKYVSNDALEELVNADISKLRLVTMEALALATWLKRIVEIKDQE